MFEQMMMWLLLMITLLDVDNNVIQCHTRKNDNLAASVTLMKPGSHGSQIMVI